MSTNDQEQEKELDIARAEEEINEEENQGPAAIYENIHSLFPETGQGFTELSLWLNTKPTSSDILEVLPTFETLETPAEGSGKGKSVALIPSVKKILAKEESAEEENKGDSKASVEGCKKQKRTRPAQLHNLKERLRRQRVKDKMESLRELVPNCSKKDKASTLDDAIKYIKSLQSQIQMMSMGEGLTMFQSGGHQGMQSPGLLPYMPLGPWPGFGMPGYGMRMYGGMTAPFNCPVNQLALVLNPYPSTSACTTSELPPLGERLGGICSDPMVSLPFTTSMCTWTPSSMSVFPSWSGFAMPGETSSQKAPSGSATSRLCESEQPASQGATARVPPSRFVLPEGEAPQISREVMDCGSVNTESTEWGSSGNSRSDESGL